MCTRHLAFFQNAVIQARNKMCCRPTFFLILFTLTKFNYTFQTSCFDFLIHQPIKLVIKEQQNQRYMEFEITFAMQSFWKCFFVAGVLAIASRPCIRARFQFLRYLRGFPITFPLLKRFFWRPRFNFSVNNATGLDRKRIHIFKIFITTVSLGDCIRKRKIILSNQLLTELLLKQ